MHRYGHGRVDKCVVRGRSRVVGNHVTASDIAGQVRYQFPSRITIPSCQQLSAPLGGHLSPYAELSLPTISTRAWPGNTEFNHCLESNTAAAGWPTSAEGSRTCRSLSGRILGSEAASPRGGNVRFRAPYKAARRRWQY